MNGNAVNGGQVVALCGGVGGARLLNGLGKAMPAALLTAIVNTGDDFEHLGLAICPDLDTVLYTLADRHDRDRGWGRSDETWQALGALAELGGDTWFQLGDRDLALHLLRTAALRAGRSLSDVTAQLAATLGLELAIVPMSDDPVRTRVDTDEGTLAFQDYFVRRRAEPVVRGLRFDGAGTARLAEGARVALASSRLAAVIICPSNPYLSIDPLLSIAELRSCLTDIPVARVAVSPIINGAAVKGPTAKIMRELGTTVSSLTVAKHYRGLIDGLVIDTSDAAEAAAIEALGLQVCVTDTLMRDDEDQQRLASETLRFAADCASRGERQASA